MLDYRVGISKLAGLNCKTIKCLMQMFCTAVLCVLFISKRQLDPLGYFHRIYKLGLSHMQCHVTWTELRTFHSSVIRLPSVVSGGYYLIFDSSSRPRP
jgi:hypothetical protein